MACAAYIPGLGSVGAWLRPGGGLLAGSAAFGAHWKGIDIFGARSRTTLIVL